MRQLRARLMTVTAVACGVLLMTPRLRADERTDARREFRAGMQAISDGQYDLGVEHLERAYEILPHPNVLYNIGLAHMYAGRTEQALEYIERYKETAPASDAVEVESLIRSLREAKPQDTPRAEPAAPSPADQAGPAGVDPALAVEQAARELRRLAEAQNSAELAAQAAELEATANRLRERQVPEPVGSAVAAPGAPSDPNAAAGAGQLAQPPQTLGLGARQRVYEEQVVSASRFSQSPVDAPNATGIITAQDIRMAGLMQLSPLLRRVAGVEVNTVTPFHSEISIRGLNRRTSNKVLLLWDGRQVRKDFLGSMWLDLMPILPDDVERIEIIRGPASALYGADAFSGVINVVTRQPTGTELFGVARVGSHGQYEAGATFASRTGNLSYRASVGYVQANNAVRVVGRERVDIEPYGVRPDLSTAALLTNGDLSYTYAKDGVLSIGGNYGGGEFTLQGFSRLGQTVTTDAYEAQGYATLTTPIGLRISGNYDLVVGHPSAAWVAPASIAETRGDVRQDMSDADLSWSGSGKVLLRQVLTLGVSYRYKRIEWNWLDGLHTQHHIGGYLQDVIQLAPPLKLQIGARVDRHPLLAQLQFSPRGSLVYRFFGEQSIRVSGGRAFRGPSFMESYLELSNETPVRGVSARGNGNSKLDPESITSIEVGYQNQQSDYFSLELNGYHNWIKDAILFTQLHQFTLGDFAGDTPLAGYDRAAQAFPISALSFANERATYRQIGGELGLRIYPVAGLDLYGSYSIHDTSPMDKRKVDEARADEQQTSLHKVNGGVQYRAPFGLEAAVDVSWFSSQLWIEQVTDVERGGLRWQHFDQPSFLLVNARLGYRLFQDRLELGVSGSNLAFEHKRQHPLAQPLDTRVLGTTKVRF